MGPDLFKACWTVKRCHLRAEQFALELGQFEVGRSSTTACVLLITERAIFDFDIELAFKSCFVMLCTCLVIGVLDHSLPAWVQCYRRFVLQVFHFTKH